MLPRPYRMVARPPADASRAICRTCKTFPVNWPFIPSNLGQQGGVPSYAASERGILARRGQDGRTPGRPGQPGSGGRQATIGRSIMARRTMNRAARHPALSRPPATRADSRRVFRQPTGRDARARHSRITGRRPARTPAPSARPRTRG